MDLLPRCTATAIGSLPHPDPERALDVIFGSIPDAPIWPQLPKLGLREQMEIQYSEGMPRAVIDEAKSRLYFDTAGDTSEALAAFYEGYLAATESGDYSVAAISPRFSAGLPALERRLRTLGRKPPFVKCQTTGPLSFALTIVDEAKRAIYYDEEFVDVVVKSLLMKCRWQIQRLKPYAGTVICFVDEPILSAFGSSTYVSVQRADVVARLGELVAAIQAEGALAGIHCCGNTEWSIPVDAGVDIVNFDAFQFGESIALYPDAMRTLLAGKKRFLAWGLVPTSAAVRDVTPARLVEQFERLTAHLAAKTGVDRQAIVGQSFLTPSCGTGSMSIPDAERVFQVLGETSRSLKQRYGF